MSRPPSRPRLPAIAVVEETGKRTLTLTRELSAEIALFAQYYEASAGKKPRSIDDVIVGLIAAYLASDAGFKKWREDRNKPAKAASQLPARQGASSST